MALHRSQQRETSQHDNLVGLLRRHGIEAAFVTPEGEFAASGASRTTPSTMLMLADATYLTNAELKRCATECASEELSLIVLVERERIAAIDVGLEIADFIAIPPDPDELIARARRALREPRPPGLEEEGIIRVGDLVIDTSSYDVTVKGSRIGLRFKEYELLRLMAENQGRVFSREVLLNQVWGYEYFGGTRTVDVHVRRLRSKIEDADHHFIETIWNVGYRFRQA